jgi:hypothetical protein
MTDATTGDSIQRILVLAIESIVEIQSFLLTQNVHLAPSTQQAEQAGFTRAKNHKTCQSIFPEN